MVREAASLRDIVILRDLEEADLEAIAERCTWRRFKRDQQVLGYMDDTHEVWFVVEGKVRAINYSLSGKEVAFRDRGAGDILGEFAAIDGGPRSANVFALEDCLLASLSPSDFWDLLQTHPEVAAATLKRLTAQVRALTERVFEFSTLAVKNRIHAELLRLCRDGMIDGTSARIEPMPTHADLASRLSTHREAVTRELNELAHVGLLIKRDRSMIVTDVGRLERMVVEVLGELPEPAD